MNFPRILWKQPFFSISAILIIAIGISLSTTASSLVKSLLFTPIPAVHSNELNRVNNGEGWGVISPPDTRDILNELSDVGLFSYSLERNIECVTDQMQFMADACEFQGDAMTILGWETLVGRTLSAKDLSASAPPVVVISNHLWKTRFGESSDVMSSFIELNGKTFAIIGVLRPEFDRINRMQKSDLWFSYFHTSEDWKYDNRNWSDQRLIVRISTKKMLVEIQNRLDLVSAHLRKKYADTSGSLHPKIISENEAIAKSFPKLAGKGKIIAALIAALLLIASLNVGNMLLANTYRRKQDFVIRRAIGASSIRLVKLILGESFTLSVMGGLLGVALSFVLIRLAGQLDFGVDIDLKLDFSTLGIATLLILLTGLLSGAIPAYQLGIGAIGSILNEGGSRGSHLSKSTRFLLASQIAFSTVLLSCGLFFYTSLHSSMRLDPGYDTENLAFFKFHMQAVTKERRNPAAKAMSDKITALPGVEIAGVGSWGPLRGGGHTKIWTEDFTPESHPDLTDSVWFFALPGYFEALGVPIVKGRTMEQGDVVFPFRNAIINETMAARFWPNTEALDQSFYPWGNASEQPVRVVGICKDHSMRPWQSPKPTFYLSEARAHNVMHVRCVGHPSTVAYTINRTLRDPNNEFVCDDLILFEDFQRDAFRDIQSTLSVIAALTIAALLLSSLGTFYITKHYVHLSRKDMCIRLAVGIHPRALVRFVVLRNMGIVLIGLVVGVLLSLMTIWHIELLIPGTENLHIPLITGVVGIMILLAGIASYFPARHVLLIQPSEVLKEI